ncbi:ubiquitination network signaling protein [Lepidopterella palustris CBS 459.81]|uniref:Ubiquitination network signaling protein n=1 Tax=Lepidopterella palustris CBS 459.81 TaxID=1314670 RepID=A0A8E2EF61_9PEZI|nr:ubiquitination network signaling protein [Lepidopterella palustris CBS 459.81]
MPPKGKRNAANQHDKRHENGLAAPGKRIQKQKSNPTLNGNANGKPQPPTPPLRPDVTQHMTLPATPNGSAHGTLADANNMAGQVPGRLIDGRGRAVSEVSLDGLEACRYENANGSLDHGQQPTPSRRIDANGTKTAPTYKGNILTVATTILSSCPLRDVLAILIILLQLPPTVLTIVHFLFATLTFVPPQTGASLSALSALPSLTDIFQGSSGTPSLFTIVFADVFILILWLLLWVPVQNFFLDLAQAVIAISLGGAAAGKGGTTNSIFLCIVIVLCSHLFRFRPLRQHIVHFFWTGLTRGGLGYLLSPPSTPSYQDSFSTPHGWPRSLLGIHILAQGVVRIIRRSLSARRESSQPMPMGKKNDPEAAVPPQIPRTNSTSMDSSTDMASSSSTDGRPPGPSPAARDLKEKTTSGKKKRKQATHVRSQQPFWAALASTKVTVLKEMEQSQAANDAGEANAKDANHIGNAVWRSEDDRVWISEVGPTSISFRVSLYRIEDFGALVGEQRESSSGPGIDRSKPFYLRVNGADWSSTRIRETTSHGYMGEEGTDMWAGEIFGLTALSNYYCEFVRSADEEVFYSASLITSAAPSAEQASIIAPPKHQTLRPSSPTTTLKNSIAAADQKLQDYRNRLKRNRKDHKAAITSVKKEVDNLSNRVATAGGSDERQRQRALQFTQNIRQAEEAAADFALQIDCLGNIPEDEMEEFAAIKREWMNERDQQIAAVADFDQAKSEADRQLASIQAEIASAIQKRERLQLRQARLNEQQERLIAANSEGFHEKSKRHQERLQIMADRASVEIQYTSNINSYERRASDFNRQNLQLHHTIQHLETLLQQSQQSIPTTPEGALPGTNGLGGPHNSFPAFHFPSLNSHINGTPGSIRGGRGRSSSMLSNISGFTDGFDDPASPPGPVLSNPFNTFAVHLNGRKGSNGSGSGSGTSSQSSSQRDPMSPVSRSLTSVGSGRSSTPLTPVGSR